MTKTKIGNCVIPSKMKHGAQEGEGKRESKIQVYGETFKMAEE